MNSKTGDPTKMLEVTVSSSGAPPSRPLSSCTTVVQLHNRSIDQSARGDKPHAGQTSTAVPRWPLHSRTRCIILDRGWNFKICNGLLQAHGMQVSHKKLFGRGHNKFCQTFSIPLNSTWTYRQKPRPQGGLSKESTMSSQLGLRRPNPRALQGLRRGSPGQDVHRRDQDVHHS